MKEEEPSELVKELIRQVGTFCTPCIEPSVEPMDLKPLPELSSMVIFKISSMSGFESTSDFLKYPISVLLGSRKKKAPANKVSDMNGEKKASGRRSKYADITFTVMGRTGRTCRCGLHILKLQTGKFPWRAWSNHAGTDFSLCKGASKHKAVLF